MFILKLAWDILRKNRLIWIFSFLFVIFQSANSLLKSDRVALNCLYALISLFTLRMMIISQNGLIGVIFGASKNEKMMFVEAWTEAKRYFWRMFFVYLIVGVIVIGILVIMIFVVQSEGMNLLSYAIIMFVAQMMWPLVIFAGCGIVIDKLGVFQSLRNSLLITLNNIFRLLAIAVVFLLAYYSIIGVSVFITWLLSGKLILAQLLSFDIMAVVDMYQIPAIKILNEIFMFAFMAIGSTIFTLAYLGYTAEIAYPDINLRSR